MGINGESSKFDTIRTPEYEDRRPDLRTMEINLVGEVPQFLPALYSPEQQNALDRLLLHVHILQRKSEFIGTRSPRPEEHASRWQGIAALTEVPDPEEKGTLVRIDLACRVEADKTGTEAAESIVRLVEGSPEHRSVVHLSSKVVTGIRLLGVWPIAEECFGKEDRVRDKNTPPRTACELRFDVKPGGTR